MTSSFRSIAVVGAGAVGSFFGAMLARAGHPVTLIGRAGARRRRSSATACGSRWPAASRRSRVAASTEHRRGARRRPGPVLRQVDRHRARSAREMAPHLGRRRARPQPAERRRERGDDRAPRASARSSPRSSTSPRRCPSRASSRTTAAAISSSARSTRRRRSDAALAAAAAGARRPVRDRAGAGAHLGRRHGRAVVEADGELRLQRDLRHRPGALRPARRARPRCASCSRRSCARSSRWPRPKASICRSRRRSTRCARSPARCPPSSRRPRRTWRAASRARSITSTASSRAAAPQLGVADAGEPGAACARQAGRERARPPLMAGAARRLDRRRRRRARRVRAGAARARPGRGRRAPRRRAARRRRLLGHLAHRHRARAGVRQARAGQAARRRRLARADRAQPLRGALAARSRTKPCPAPRRACSASTRASACSSMA